MYHLTLPLFRYQYFETVVFVREAVFMRECSSVGIVTRLQIGRERNCDSTVRILPQISADKFCTTTTLISIVARNLQTEFKEGSIAEYSTLRLCCLS